MLVEHLFDNGEIEIRHTQHIAYQVTLASGIQVDAIPHHLVVRQTDHTRQTFQAFFVDRIGKIDILRIIVTILIHFRKILHMPGMEQTIHVCIETFRYQAHYVRERVCR